MSNSAKEELRANLVLVGGRGSGKSSIARRIARSDKRFMLFSLDALIRYESGGRSIPDIVAAHGWRHFRDVEREVVDKVAGFRAGALVDCGGGVVVDLNAEGEEVFSRHKVKALRKHGRVVYLRRDPEYLLSRIAGDTDRPALSARASFLEIMARREPWYAAAAHYVVEAGERSKRDVVDEVTTWFHERG